MPGWYRARQQASIAARRPQRAFSRMALALAGMLSLLVAACGTGNSGAPALAKNQTFVWPYMNDVESMSHGEVFDPATITWYVDSTTTSMIYSGLVTFNSTTLQVVPDAATSWDVTSAGKVYTFHLRPNMRFSDGTPLTATDFAYGINRALDPTLCSVADRLTYGPAPTQPGQQGGTGACAVISATYLNAIQGAGARLAGSGGNDHSMIGQGDDPNHGVDIIDPLTLRIRLAQPSMYFLEALTYPTSYPVEAKLVKQYPGGTWVDHLDQGGCSGPFEVKSYGGGKQLTLVPNPYWQQAWGKKLTLTEVDRPLVRSQKDEYQNYRGGQYDYTDVPGSSFASAKGQADFHEVAALWTNYFGLNLNLAPFDNPLVRVAFDLALNKQYLVDSTLKGAAAPTNHIVPRGMPGYNATLVNPSPDKTQSLTGNQTAAKNLIDQARQACQQGTSQYSDSCAYLVDGPNSSPIVVWYPTGNETRAAITDLAVQFWSDTLGLNVQDKSVDPNTFGSVMYSGGPVTYQAWNIGWIADYPDPQDWLSLQFHTNAPYNSSGVHDADLDALIDKADREQNPTQRMSEYNQIEQRVVNLCAWIPYDQQLTVWRQRSWVQGFTLNALGGMADIDWTNVYIQQH